MTGQRWITAAVLVAVMLVAMIMLSGLHDQMSGSATGYALHTLSDQQLVALRDAVGPSPDPPCDPSLPLDSLPGETRKRCNRHYLGVVKAARAIGFEGARIRDVRDLRFYRRFIDGY